MTANNMQPAASKVILVTGASSGIGEETARLLAGAGHQLVLGARRIDRLDALATEIHARGGSAIARRLDVCDAADVRNFVGAASERFGKVDVIINNAGVMPLSRLEALKLDEWNRMIDVNIRGVLHGIAAVLPVFKHQQAGHVINIASIGAYTVYPTAAIYCATKFAVAAITEGLRQEAPEGLRVTLVSPGTVASELADSISDPEARQGMQEFRRITISPGAIARAIQFAIDQPADVDVSELIVRPVASPY
jgi:NADP-dependent 3-hydroxy acid dehydrogenase YdfG